MRKTALLLMLVSTAAAGCGPKFAVPNLYCPGTAQVQRRRAEHFDPYPQPVSRTEMVGVRPRDYEKPTEESNRSEWPWCPGTVVP